MNEFASMSNHDPWDNRIPNPTMMIIGILLVTAGIGSMLFALFYAMLVALGL